MNKVKFINLCYENGLQIDQEDLSKLDKYIELLQQWNEKMNLTAIVEYEQVLDKHIMDCIYPTFKYPIHGKIADVGSGAGFPGIVWAIFYPNCSFTLIEPTLKRCHFLNEVKNQLQLDNVIVINKRSEDCKELKNSFDIVTARAVANLNILSELCLPLLKDNGRFYALKGSHANDELENAHNALRQLMGRFIDCCEYICEDDGHHITLIIEKTGKIDDKYPRLYSHIKKKPL